MPLQKTRRLRGKESEQRAGRAVAAERRRRRGEADADTRPRGWVSATTPRPDAPPTVMTCSFGSRYSLSLLPLAHFGLVCPRDVRSGRDKRPEVTVGRASASFCEQCSIKASNSCPVCCPSFGICHLRQHLNGSKLIAATATVAA